MRALLGFFLGGSLLFLVGGDGFPNSLGYSVEIGDGREISRLRDHAIGDRSPFLGLCCWRSDDVRLLNLGLEHRNFGWQGMEVRWSLGGNKSATMPRFVEGKLRAAGSSAGGGVSRKSDKIGIGVAEISWEAVGIGSDFDRIGLEAAEIGLMSAGSNSLLIPFLGFAAL